MVLQLAITNDELLRIIEGDGEMTMETLVKLVIGSGHAIEIKPVEQSELSGEYDALDIFKDEDEEDTRPEHEPIVELADDDEDVPLEEMGFDDLAEIIEDNGWEDEIDIYYASREDLIDFIKEKEDELDEEEELEEDSEDEDEKEVEKEEEKSSDAAAKSLEEKLRTAFDKNPHLAELFAKLID